MRHAPTFDFQAHSALALPKHELRARGSSSHSGHDSGYYSHGSPYNLPPSHFVGGVEEKSKDSRFPRVIVMSAADTSLKGSMLQRDAHGQVLAERKTMGELTGMATGM